MDGREISGKITQSGGGVARNIADALGKLRVNPYFISAVGDEPFGSYILDQTVPHLDKRGIARSKDATTGVCMVLCDHTGECLMVVGDMAIHQKISEAQIKSHEKTIAQSSLVVLDGNLSQEVTEFVLRLCHHHSVPVWFEPTDVIISSKPFLNKTLPFPKFISPNFKEFQNIYKTLYPEDDGVSEGEQVDQIEECIQKGLILAQLIDNIIITLGKKGVMVIRKGKPTDPFFTTSGKPKYIEKDGEISHRLYKPDPVSSEDIVNVSGAGDCFASGFIAAMLKGESETSCIEFGFKCSTASLKCSQTVPLKF